MPFSPDGKLFATTSHTSRIRLWSVPQLRTVCDLYGHDDVVWDLAFSGEPLSLASASADGTVRIWNVIKRELLMILSGPAHSVRAVAASPDGSLVAGLSADGTVYVWDRRTGDPRHVFQAHAEPGSAIAFVNIRREKPPNNDGTHRPHYDKRFEDLAVLFTAGTEGAIRMWQPPFGEPLSLVNAGQAVYALSFDYAHQTLACAGADGTVALWDVAKRSLSASFGPVKGWLFDVALSPTGQQIVAGGSDCVLHVWEVKHRTHRQ
ncbi:MAG: WD40 repeat domain-containing protein, partial [Solirubrobacteraceae bacterium]